MAVSEGMKHPGGSMLQGRGGAGNIAPRSPALDPADLTTPTIKSDLYTTGRGGTGNMALNLHSHPEYSRAAQDVDALPVLGREPENSVHYGRGGAANVAHMSKEAKAGARERNERRRRSEANGQVGQFGREHREAKGKGKAKEGSENKEAAGAAAAGDHEKAKSKNVLEKSFAKLTRVMSSK